jgi:hypothetical protein
MPVGAEDVDELELDALAPGFKVACANSFAEFCPSFWNFKENLTSGFAASIVTALFCS